MHSPSGRPTRAADSSQLLARSSSVQQQASLSYCTSDLLHLVTLSVKAPVGRLRAKHKPQPFALEGCGLWLVPWLVHMACLLCPRVEERAETSKDTQAAVQQENALDPETSSLWAWSQIELGTGIASQHCIEHRAPPEAAAGRSASAGAADARGQAQTCQQANAGANSCPDRHLLSSTEL